MPRLKADRLAPRLRHLFRRSGIATIEAEAGDRIVPAGERLARRPIAPALRPAHNGYRTTALIIACAMFMEHLDSTVLATALPTMGRDFGVPAAQMSITLSCYLLALAIFIPASGHLADRFGGKRVFQIAIVLFVAGSLSCGLAPNLTMLVVARFAQGIAGAMMMPVGRLLLLRSVAKEQLISAMSWLLAPAMVGPILGPPVGGLIVTYLDWRWIFWVNVPIGIIGSILVARHIEESGERMARAFDWQGFVVSALSLGCLLFGFENASRPGGGSEAITLIAIGLLSGGLYLVRARRSANPIIDIRLLAVPTFRLSTIGGSLTRITQGAQPFLLPMMMQLAFGFSPATSGLLTVAPALGSFVMKAFAPSILTRFGFRNSLVVGGILSVGAYAACGMMREGWPPIAIFALMTASGFLMSFQFTAYNLIAYDEIDSERMSASTSFYSTFQQLTLSLGICIGATALHLSSTMAGRTVPTFRDFTAAFFAVTAISIVAVFVNTRFDRDAGREMTRQR